jgi:hypothetical protein
MYVRRHRIYQKEAMKQKPKKAKDNLNGKAKPKRRVSF